MGRVCNERRGASAEDGIKEVTLELKDSLYFDSKQERV